MDPPNKRRRLAPKPPDPPPLVTAHLLRRSNLFLTEYEEGPVQIKRCQGPDAVARLLFDW